MISEPAGKATQLEVPLMLEPEYCRQLGAAAPAGLAAATATAKTASLLQARMKPPNARVVQVACRRGSPRSGRRARRSALAYMQTLRRSAKITGSSCPDCGTRAPPGRC